MEIFGVTKFWRMPFDSVEKELNSEKLFFRAGTSLFFLTLGISKYGNELDGLDFDVKRKLS